MDDLNTILNFTDEELFKRVDNSNYEAEKITAPRYSYWKSVARVFFNKKINTIILTILAIIIVFSFVYPMFVEFNKFENQSIPGAAHLSPIPAIEKFGFDLKWILGTGGVGQSTFIGLWHGARISISLALICAAINLIIGIIIGAIWGYSKKFDSFMTEVYNIIGNVPYILIVSVLVMIIGAGFASFVFALTITGWLGIAYFIRTQVIIIRDREYNLASRCLGTPIIRLTMKNILPFLTSIIVTLAATEIPSYISYEVFLSYIGFGLNEVSLGKLIQEGEAAMLVAGWEFEFWSPVVISAIITVVLYVVGQNLGDASDPRTHI